MIDWVTEVRNKPAEDPRRYNWSQAPGVSISAGSRTINLSPMPLGLAVGNNVYAQGGTGTAEAVAITAVGASSITATFANSHSGAWTIGTSSSGVQEAIVIAGSAGAVCIPAGLWPVYAPININASYQNFVLCGEGPQTSILSNQSTTTDVIDWPVTSGFVRMSNFGVLGQANATGGWAFHIGGATFGQLDHLWIEQGYGGMYIANANSWLVDSCYGFGLNNIGLQIDATNGQVVASTWSNLFFFTTHGLTDTAALYMTTQTGGTFAGPTFTNSWFIGGAVGVLAQLAASTNMNEVVFLGGDITGTVYGAKIVAHGAVAYNWRFEGLQYLASIGTGGSAGPAISMDDGCTQFAIVSNAIQCGGGFTCIDVKGASLVTISNNDIGGGTAAMITIEPGNGTPANMVKIQGNNIGYVKTTTYGTYGITTSADAHTGIMVQNNRIYGATAAVQFQATGAGSLFSGNYIDPTSGSPGQPTASAAIIGSTWFTPGAPGVKDSYQVAAKDASNAYAWRTIY